MKLTKTGKTTRKVSQTYPADQHLVAATSQQHCSSSSPASISHEGLKSSKPTAAADQQLQQTNKQQPSATSKKEDLVAISVDQ